MSIPDRKIQVLCMGGTLDSRWEGKLDTVIINEHSAMPDYFKNLIIYAEVSFVEVAMKDSRELRLSDLEKLLETIEESAYKKIIITHGTYSMPDTAKYLKANLARRDQTIVLTGSMIPLKGFESSDAPFNLGYALAKVENLPAGVYVCMNGRTFDPDEIAKNLAEGKYFSVFEKKQ